MQLTSLGVGEEELDAAEKRENRVNMTAGDGSQSTPFLVS